LLELRSEKTVNLLTSVMETCGKKGRKGSTGRISSFREVIIVRQLRGKEVSPTTNWGIERVGQPAICDSENELSYTRSDLKRKTEKSSEGANPSPNKRSFKKSYGRGKKGHVYMGENENRRKG